MLRHICIDNDLHILLEGLKCWSPLQVDRNSSTKTLTKFWIDLHTYCWRLQSNCSCQLWEDFCKTYWKHPKTLNPESLLGKQNMLKSFGFRTGDTIDGQNPAALEGWRAPFFLQKRCMHPRSWTINSTCATSTPSKFNSSLLKNDGWKTILSFWGPVIFQGLLQLNFQGVPGVPFCLKAASTKSQMVLQGENITFLHILCQVHQHDAQLEVSKWPSCRKKMLRPSKDCGCIQATCKISFMVTWLKHIFLECPKQKNSKRSHQCQIMNVHKSDPNV